MEQRLHQANLFSQWQIYGSVGGQPVHLLQRFGAKGSLENVVDELIRASAAKVIGGQGLQGQIGFDVKLLFERSRTRRCSKERRYELLDVRFTRQGEQGLK